MLALITATRNSRKTIQKTLVSVQGFETAIKHIFIDGDSTDGTKVILQDYVEKVENALLVTQDGSGLYEALNEGIRVALADPSITHIGVLHSDDRLVETGFKKALTVLEREPVDVLYSDIQFHDSANEVVRVWRAGEYNPRNLKLGWMPPHTSVIAKKAVYAKIGSYDPSYGTAADYHWLVRMLRSGQFKMRYLPSRTVSMLLGGASNSSLRSRILANSMDGKVWKDAGWWTVLLVRVAKPLRKIAQFSRY